jgi:hypothetical protein
MSLSHLGMNNLTKERLLKAINKNIVHEVVVTTPVGKDANGQWVRTGSHQVKLIADEFVILFSPEGVFDFHGGQISNG